MNVYVGITDGDWYDYLSGNQYTEVNFWKPSGKSFKTLQEGDLFLLKLKAGRGGKIAGGGFFVSATTTSIEWAWRAFGNENGVNSLTELSDKIWRYKGEDALRSYTASVTCIILMDVFYFSPEDWFDAPGNWRSIVSGKTFRQDDAESKWLIDQVQLRLMGRGLTSAKDDARTIPSAPSGYVIGQSKHRIGQGAFRTLVADAYQRRCAITGERTMPVLQAAHIRSFGQEGPNAVNNGILLRSDMHALFDAGYITIDDDLRVVVSRRLHDDYGNGKDYYPYHGRRLSVVPERAIHRPAKEYLDWHHDHVFFE